MRQVLLGLTAFAIVATIQATPWTAAASLSPVDLAAQRGADVVSRSKCSGSIEKVLTEVGGQRADLGEELQGEYQGIPGFRVVVHDADGPVVIVDPARLGEWKERMAETGVRVAPSCVSETLIVVAQAAVSRLLMGEGDFGSAGYDAITDAVTVDSTFPIDEVLGAIESALGGTTPTAGEADVTRVQITRSERGSVSRASRTDDAPDFYGGAKIQIDIGTGSTFKCTTGFYINSASNGTVMLTAGHCSNYGTWPLTVYNGNVTYTLGSTESVHFPDPDLAVIDGSTYAAYSYSAQNQTSFKPIKSSSEPEVSTSYCQFGYASLRICSTYNALDSQYCDSFGCTNHLAYTSRTCPSGDLSVPGDSGAGVFRELSNGTLGARGMVVAGETAGTCPYKRWDHKLSTILSTYSATVVYAP